MLDRAAQRAQDALEINARLVAATGDRQEEALSAALEAGSDLIDRAGDRQDRVTGEILDLARGTLGQTSNVQVRLITWALLGAAAIVFAGRWRAAA